MFDAASGFQINGGIFYGISGDMNIHGVQPTIGQGSNPLRVLESGLNTSTRQLVGVQRHGRQGEATRMTWFAGHLVQAFLMDLATHRPQLRSHYLSVLSHLHRGDETAIFLCWVFLVHPVAIHQMIQIPVGQIILRAEPSSILRPTIKATLVACRKDSDTKTGRIRMLLHLHFLSKTIHVSVLPEM
ncbi:hypothetical protein MSAN_00175500 [Mycena sanguinolenta]|uniref:Uncharacterized protein n=1 Tax=Mycena sanguinolenta TaxID=230812 RepID=A0A8H6ZHA7_9AGAR|nr:hypothetical protein MSAN_00175500 [Mycena sanguinolenta]